MKKLLTVLLAAGFFLLACRHQPAFYLQSCTFCKDSTDTAYQGAVHWYGNNWRTKVCFQDDSFAGTADLTYNRFLDTAVFTDATFLSSADFSHDTFNRAVYFDDVTFLKDAHFEYARFPHYAKFTNLVSTAGGTIRFDDATLPDTLDFSQNPALLGKIDLTTANFDDPDPHYLFLYNTDISKFKLDYFHFRLLVPDSTITPSLDSIHQRITKDQKEAMYEALLANFKNNGQEESYKRLDIEYQQFKWRSSGAPVVAWVLAIWWNFGYSKGYVFIWIGVSLLVFSLINSGCLGMLNDHVYEVFKPGVVDGKARYGRKLWQSLIYTSNIFFRLTLDRDGMKFEKFWPTLYFFLIYVLGVLCLGYLANFVLQP